MSYYITTETYLSIGPSILDICRQVVETCIPAEISDFRGDLKKSLFTIRAVLKHAENSVNEPAELRILNMHVTISTKMGSILIYPKKRTDYAAALRKIRGPTTSQVRTRVIEPIGLEALISRLQDDPPDEPFEIDLVIPDGFADRVSLVCAALGYAVTLDEYTQLRKPDAEFYRAALSPISNSGRDEIALAR